MSTDVPISDLSQASIKLPDDVGLLQQMIRELLESMKKLQHDRDGLQERLDLLLRKLYGQKAERYDPNQPVLFAEMQQPETPAESPVVETPSVEPKAKRPGHGRKKIPDHLRRERIVHEIPEESRTCACCGEVQQKFGEEVSEQLDYIPASLFVKQHIRFKYACLKCHQGVTVAPKPAQPIDKGLPGPGLLAQIATSKYDDHLPLHRLERIFERQGVELSRAVMCTWMGAVGDRLRPIVDSMLALMLTSRVIHTDATKLPYQLETTKGKTESGQMWVYVGDRLAPFHIFDFSPDHSGTRIRKLLGSYQGFLSADAHNVYDSLFRKPNEPIQEVGCWAHGRRYFFDAKANDVVRAHEAMARIRSLYKIEEEAKKIIHADKLQGDVADALVRQLRQEKSLPILTSFRAWLLEQQPMVLPKSLIAQAINYSLNHWQALTRYLDHGYLAIDNNTAENALRAIALGRKNWLFAGNERGARTAATLFTLTSSCRRHRIDSFAYLRDVLERMTAHPNPDPAILRELLPDRWRPPAGP